MYTIIEKQTGHVIITTSDETIIETFFEIEDIDKYDVIDSID